MEYRLGGPIAAKQRSANAAGCTCASQICGKYAEYFRAASRFSRVPAGAAFLRDRGGAVQDGWA